MYRTGSFSLVNRTFEQDNKKYPKLRGSVGSDLHGLEQDRAIKTDPGEARRRRTIKLHRNRGQSCGFTLQTYGIRNKRTREVEIMSYVDYVEIDGPAWVAGMRRGDIILSVNGESVEGCTHRELVRKIQGCTRELRLVVLFEDCCQKVELHERYLKLKRLLSQKVKELRGLEAEEKKISQGIPLLRCDSFRQSTYSSTSSDWDIYSEITSPTLFDCVPVNRFAFRENCSQSISDISTESSANSADSLSSASSFMPKGEEDCISLKSSYAEDDEKKTSGSKCRVTRDNNFQRSTFTEHSSMSSSKVLKTENSSISKSQLLENDGVSTFITDDDRLSSFIQDDDRLFSFIQGDDRLSSFIQGDDRLSSFIQGDDRLSSFVQDNNSMFSCVQLEGNKHFSLPSDLDKESAVFSLEKAEVRQKCMMCGLEQIDNNEKQQEDESRHTFHGSPSADSMVQSCAGQPDVSLCFTVSDTPSCLTPESNPVVDTLCRLEEYSCLASAADLKARNISSQRLAALPCVNHTIEAAKTHNREAFIRLGHSETEESAQCGQDGESVAEVTCALVCTDLAFSYDALLCGACKHTIVSCACSNTKCQDISNSNTKCQDISNSNTRCQDISNSNTKCQDISNSNTKCQDISNSNTRCQDISNSNTKCQDISNSNTKCQDSDNTTKYEDISDSNIKCQDISDNNTKYQDISDNTTKYQDISDSNTKCQDSDNNTKYQDISDNNTKYQDISDYNTKYQDISDNNTKCQDISDSNTKCQDTSDSNTKCQDISNNKFQDSINSTTYQDSCSKCQDNRCQGSGDMCVCSMLSYGKYSADSEQSCQTSQARGDYSCIVTPSIPVLPEFFSHASAVTSITLDNTTDQACISNKKRLVNGVLVNDRSYSTRL